MIFLSHHFSNDDELFSFSVFEFPRFSKTLFMPHCPTFAFVYFWQFDIKRRYGKPAPFSCFIVAEVRGG
jgi:hypothetical protein